MSAYIDLYQSRVTVVSVQGSRIGSTRQQKFTHTYTDTAVYERYTSLYMYI